MAFNDYLHVALLLGIGGMIFIMTAVEDCKGPVAVETEPRRAKRMAVELPTTDLPLKQFPLLTNDLDKNARYLVGELSTTASSHLGAVLFKINSFIGIAQNLNRTPVLVTNRGGAVKNNVRFINNLLPKLFSGIKWISEESLTAAAPNISWTNLSERCCVYENLSKFDSFKNMWIFGMHIQHAKSFKYFENLTSPGPLERINTTEEYVKMVEDEVKNPSLMPSAAYRLCVHTRRGSFLSSPLAHSTEEAVIFAAKHIASKALRKAKGVVAVIFLGDDAEWMRNVALSLRKQSLFQVGSTNRGDLSKHPKHFDLIYSRLYCDAFFLSAPASSYGWWLAYLSKGQNVYYNMNLYKTSRTQLEAQKMQADYFPKNWTGIEINVGAVEEVPLSYLAVYAPPALPSPNPQLIAGITKQRIPETKMPVKQI